MESPAAPSQCIGLDWQIDTCRLSSENSCFTPGHSFSFCFAKSSSVRTWKVGRRKLHRRHHRSTTCVAVIGRAGSSVTLFLCSHLFIHSLIVLLCYWGLVQRSGCPLAPFRHLLTWYDLIASLSSRRFRAYNFTLFNCPVCNLVRNVSWYHKLYRFPPWMAIWCSYRISRRKYSYLLSSCSTKSRSSVRLKR